MTVGLSIKRVRSSGRFVKPPVDITLPSTPALDAIELIDDAEGDALDSLPAVRVSDWKSGQAIHDVIEVSQMDDTDATPCAPDHESEDMDS